MKDMLFLQGGGVIPEQYSDFLDQFRDLYNIYHYDYPVDKESIIDEYSDFIIRKLSEETKEGIKPDVIIAHSLGCSIAMELVANRKFTAKTILVSPLLSSIVESEIIFAIEAISQSESAPHINHLSKYIRNIPVFISELNKINDLNISQEKFNKLKDVVTVITEEDELIPKEKQLEVVGKYKNIKKNFVTGGHGWITHNPEAADTIKKILNQLV